MEWQDFNLSEPISAGQPVTADLVNAIVNNLQVIKEE